MEKLIFCVFAFLLLYRRDAISSSVVSEAVVFLWICIDFDFGIEISIPASSREPAAMDAIGENMSL